MPKRRPSSATEPLDIFSSPRLSTAMAAATSPEPLPPPAPEPAEPALTEDEEPRETSLRSVPRPAEEAPKADPGERAKPPETAPETPSKPAAKARKGRAEPAAEPEPEELPEPNVPLKFRVPQTLRSEFQTFKAELSAALGGVVLDDSNLGRPLLEHFLVDQRDRILEAAEAYKGKLRRPANGDAVGMAEFDHTLGEIFGEARKRRRAAPTTSDA
jgi:hypothetical protein